MAGLYMDRHKDEMTWVDPTYKNPCEIYVKRHKELES